MKHKLWLIMLTFVTSLCLTFSLSACGLFDLIAPEGPGGSQGGTEQGGTNPGTNPGGEQGETESPPLPDLPQNGYSDNGLYFELNEDGRSYTVSKGDFNGTSLNIPATFNGAPVTAIGSFAFSGCSGLTNVTIPDSVTAIGSSAFSNCNGLTGELAIPNSVTSIGGCAFYLCSGLTSITIPDSVTSIGSNAFEGTAYYDDATNWDEGCVLYIGNYLIDAKNTISGSYTIRPDTKVIADEAFWNCDWLTSIEIPNSVTSIGSCAFWNCDWLTGTLKIPDSVTSIGNDAFNCCSGLTSITIPDSVTSIGSSAFYGTAYDNDPSNWDESGVLYIGNYLIDAKETISGSYTIRANTKVIADGAFWGRRGLTSITIPDSVTSIGWGAFRECSGLESVTIGRGVTSIGSNSFWRCSGLKEVHITDLAAWCRIDFGDEYANPARQRHLYLDGAEIENLTIPSGIAQIKKYAFYNCSGLMSVAIPDSATSIGDYAFSGCSKLTSVTIGSGVTWIGMYAFSGCKGLTSVTIPDSVTTIGDWAFRGCSGLTSILVEAGNTIYHSEENCLIETASKTLILGCKTSKISNDGSVTSIGGCAFYNCRGLTSITIPDSVTSIGSYAFYDCSGLKTVYYKGSAEEWGNISIDNTYSSNSRLFNATRYYFTEDAPTVEEWASYDYWWHYDPDTSLPSPWVKNQ